MCIITQEACNVHTHLGASCRKSQIDVQDCYNAISNRFRAMMPLDPMYLRFESL